MISLASLFDASCVRIVPVPKFGVGSITGLSYTPQPHTMLLKRS